MWERAESAFLPGLGKPKRGSFGDYVSKVDQFITNKRTKLNKIRTRLSRQYVYVCICSYIHQIEYDKSD